MADMKIDPAAAQGSGTTQFAGEYFRLVSTTKKIKKSDVDFFFRYFRSECNNKKAILEMLRKELKVHGLGKEGAYPDEKEAEEAEGKKKDGSNPLITCLFQEATVLKIRRAVEKYEEAKQDPELCLRYPKLGDSLYEYLEIDNVSDADQLKNLMATRGGEVYAVCRESGTDSDPVVELFRILQDISDHRDVVDNIPEVKLLLKYPALTPYMYSFVEMKPATVKGMVEVAGRYYAFEDEKDFIMHYYLPLRDNFGISDSGISGIIRKAEKEAEQNNELSDTDENPDSKEKQKISIGMEIIHWLVYWPVVAVYFVFEVAKTIVTELHRFALPVFVALFLINNWLFPSLLGVENLLVLRKVFFKEQWLSYLKDFPGVNIDNGVEVLLLSLITVLLLLTIYVLPALFAAEFIAEFADDLNKRFDWMGLERTFQQVFMSIRKKTEDQIAVDESAFVKNMIPKIIVNILSFVILLAVIHFLPVGIHALSEVTGYGQ